MGKYSADSLVCLYLELYAEMDKQVSHPKLAKSSQVPGQCYINSGAHPLLSCTIAASIVMCARKQRADRRSVL